MPLTNPFTEPVYTLWDIIIIATAVKFMEILARKYKKEIMKFVEAYLISL